MAKKHRPQGWPATPEELPLPVVDNHTHLESLAEWIAPGWDGENDGARTIPLADQLARAAAVGVDRLVTVACDVDAITWTDAFLANDDENRVLGAAAIHPNEAVLHARVREVAPDGLAPDVQPRHALALDEAIARVESAVRANPKFRAIGETGLDYFRAGPAGRAVQREVFRAHIALAKELGLPLQIHDREAHEDVVEILLADGAPERTVFHCFSGEAELARVCAENGWFVSVAGPVTFRANDGLRAAVAAIPLELLLTETDAPYLTPHPDRGRPNAPYLMPTTVREIARVRAESHGDTLEDVCRVTSQTAEALYGPW